MNINYKLNLFHDLEQKYVSIARNNPEEFDRLISAILVIENLNRSILWRLLEYIAVLYEIIFHKYITNYSIWRCQVKISMIFDYYNIEYKTYGKYLYYKRVSKLRLIFLLFKDNYIPIIKNALYSKFGEIDMNNLNYKELEDIALYYSRNLEFNDEINYYSIIRHLYYDSFASLAQR